MKIGTDDDVWRLAGIWLGPRGKTLPVHARYLAWAVWAAVTFPVWAALLALRILPPLTVFVLAPGIGVLAAYALMGVVDHDRPIRSWWQTARCELTAPRPAKVRRWVVRAR
jgi:hypothetical protein